VHELASFKEAMMDQKWMAAMQEELFMIEKIKLGNWFENLMIEMS